MTDAEIRRIEAQWKSDMDAKVDRLCAFAATYEEYLKLCLKREVDRDKMRSAIMEKTLGGVVWAGLLVMAAAVWEYMRGHIK